MTANSLFGLLVTLIISGVIFYLLVWLIGWVGLPEPFAKVAKIIVGLIAILYLIGLMTGYAPRFL